LGASRFRERQHFRDLRLDGALDCPVLQAALLALPQPSLGTSRMTHNDPQGLRSKAEGKSTEPSIKGQGQKQSSDFFFLLTLPFCFLLTHACCKRACHSSSSRPMSR